MLHELMLYWGLLYSLPGARTTQPLVLNSTPHSDLTQPVSEKYSATPTIAGSASSKYRSAGTHSSTVYYLGSNDPTSPPLHSAFRSHSSCQHRVNELSTAMFQRWVMLLFASAPLLFSALGDNDYTYLLCKEYEDLCVENEEGYCLDDEPVFPWARGDSLSLCYTWCRCYRFECDPRLLPDEEDDVDEDDDVLDEDDEGPQDTESCRNRLHSDECVMYYRDARPDWNFNPDYRNRHQRQCYQACSCEPSNEIS
ncbi:MAG: hypothetical protein M1837_004363 [Sclerophora amabilis]|nr:MAG: hypothetical protein M1837_004363 [Sclerophora amabilis]